MRATCLRCTIRDFASDFPRRAARGFLKSPVDLVGFAAREFPGMLQTSSFNQTHVLVASNSISLSCLDGRIYIIIVLNPLLVLIILLIHCLFSLRVEDTPGNTLVHTLAHDKYSPARWVSRKLRPKSKTISCYTSDCFKSSCSLFVDTLS